MKNNLCRLDSKSLSVDLWLRYLSSKNISPESNGDAFFVFETRRTKQIIKLCYNFIFATHLSRNTGFYSVLENKLNFILIFLSLL